MLVTSIGLFKMWYWSYVAAITLLIIKLLYLTVKSIIDINTMIENSLSSEAIPPVIASNLMPVLVVCFFIFYLLRSSTRNRFKTSTEQ